MSCCHPKSQRLSTSLIRVFCFILQISIREDLAFRVLFSKTRCREIQCAEKFDDSKDLYLVVLSSILPWSHGRSYCYNEFCRYMHFARAKRFLSPHMVAHRWSNDLVEIRHAHVRAKKWPLHKPHSRLQHAEFYSLSNALCP